MLGPIWIMWEEYLSSTTKLLLQQKFVEKCFKFKVDRYTLTQKKLFTFWDAKFAMLLFMLERLKQSFALDLVIIKVKTDFSEKENIMYHRNVFTHIVFRIVIKRLILRNSFYFRRLKRAGNFKKEKSVSTNWKYFLHLI